MRYGKEKIISVLILMLVSCSIAFSNDDLAVGKKLYESRCAMCHGANANATGPLAQKSNPPTPDLTTPAFKERLRDYPGVIVASVVLRPNGNLIPNILKQNGIKLPPHTWTEDELRTLNQYILLLIQDKSVKMDSTP